MYTALSAQQETLHGLHQPDLGLAHTRTLEAYRCTVCQADSALLRRCRTRPRS